MSSLLEVERMIFRGKDVWSLGLYALNDQTMAKKDGSLKMIKA
jgi:hypothetical protein